MNSFKNTKTSVKFRLEAGTRSFTNLKYNILLIVLNKKDISYKLDISGILYVYVI